MTGKQIFALLLALLLAVTLFGCTAQSGTPVNSDDISDSVENLFDNPTAQTEPHDSSEATVLEDLENNVVPGVTRFGYAPPLPEDELGGYYIYEGGQMCISLIVGVQGFRMTDLGILLFLDGQIQPYATSPDGEVKYVHTFYPKRENVYDLYITPLVGKTGETLELTYLYLSDLDYSVDEESDVFVPFKITRGLVTRVKFEATPPAQETPPLADYLVSWSTEYADLTSGDTVGWTADDYAKEVRHSVTIDGYEDPGISYETTKDELIPARFELKGSPAAEFSLIILLDNLPVSVAPEDLIFIQTEQGKKLIVEALIDFRDFDGASEIRVVVVPRNWHAALLGASCEIWCYDYYWFVDDPTPENYSRR